MSEQCQSQARVKYGLEFPPEIGDLDIELYCFRIGHPVEEGGLGKPGHFKAATAILFPDFQWHPWADEGLIALCDYNCVSLTGCASSGKTGLASIWGLINFFCSPHNTLVAVTTTSITKARKLIWGDMKERYSRIGNMPFKLVDTPVPMIRHTDPQFSERSSISLIPAEQKQDAESIEKLVGLKNERVILLVDEGPEMPPGIISALDNLNKNPFFQVVILGNAADVFDPHGMLSTPKDGWNSITVEDTRWETERGICLHYDGLKSPNLIHGDKWPFLYTSKMLEQDRRNMGENSPNFWRQVRGFWRAGGNEDNLYSAAEISQAGGLRKNVVEREGAIMLAGGDPAFTSGGDRFIVYFGLLGRGPDGNLSLEFDGYEHLRIDLTKKDRPAAYQYCDLVKKACEARGVKPFHYGQDATGSGITFYDLMTVEWSRSIRRIGFGEKASNTKIAYTDKKTAAETYRLRVDELWGVGIRLLRAKRLYGIGADLAREMVSRRYKQEDKIRVESKEEMKLRTGRSPDIADAAFVLLDVARQCGLTGGIGSSRSELEEWRKMRETYENAFRNPAMTFRHS